MAGHSQFKNIMHRKGAQDNKRAKVFTKLGKEISVAVKTGGGADPTMNPKLRAALAGARAVNMPKDNIEKAIKRATGGQDAANYEAMTYEGYGPGGVAIVVEALTDNRNRTAADVRAIFNKHGGNLGADGSVSFLFEYCGIIKVEKNNLNFDTLFEEAAKEGAIDVIEEDSLYLIKTASEDLHKINQALVDSLKIDPISIGFDWLPKTEIELNEEEALKIIKMLNALEDNDDVQNVFSNFSTSLEVLQKIQQ
ncbi:YebC/PmpR family DNA-binding transcriptional regulator [Rickettsiales bacterium LUAb2]